MWLLDEARRLLPLASATQFWQQELILVGKMLTLDSRNFHGWSYRRLVVETLQQLATSAEAASLTQKEYEYAKKMIGANLSNFSAWHYRTKLIVRLLEEQSASDEERRKMLDDGRFDIPDYQVFWSSWYSSWLIGALCFFVNRAGPDSSGFDRSLRSVSMVLSPKLDVRV